MSTRQPIKDACQDIAVSITLLLISIYYNKSSAEKWSNPFFTAKCYAVISKKFRRELVRISQFILKIVLEQKLMNK